MQTAFLGSGQAPAKGFVNRAMNSLYILPQHSECSLAGKELVVHRSMSDGGEDRGKESLHCGAHVRKVSNPHSISQYLWFGTHACSTRDLCGIVREGFSFRGSLP